MDRNVNYGLFLTISPYFHHYFYFPKIVKTARQIATEIIPGFQIFLGGSIIWLWNLSPNQSGCVCMPSCFSHVQLCATLWTVAIGSSVQRILRVKILEWVAMLSSKGSSWPRDCTCVSCIAGGFFNCWATSETQIHVVIQVQIKEFLKSINGPTTNFIQKKKGWGVKSWPKTFASSELLCFVNIDKEDKI